MPDLTPEPEHEHEHAPKPGTAYSASGLPANLSFKGHYPVEAHCSCGFMIRLEHIGLPGDGSKWQSTGRRPGGLG